MCVPFLRSSQARLPEIAFTGCARDRYQAAEQFPASLRDFYGPDDKCECGQHMRDGTHQPVSNRRDGMAYVYGLSGYRELEVYELRCTCGKLHPYDGAGQGMVNMNNHDIFTHHLLLW